MHINFHSITSSFTQFAQEKILPTLTHQQKRIAALAAAALLCLAVYFLLTRCWCKGKVEISDQKSPLIEKDPALPKDPLHPEALLDPVPAPAITAEATQAKATTPTPPSSPPPAPPLPTPTSKAPASIPASIPKPVPASITASIPTPVPAPLPLPTSTPSAILEEPESDDEALEEPLADIRLVRHNQPRYGNWNFVNPHISKKMKPIEKRLEQELQSLTLSRQDAKDMYASFRKELSHQQCLKILFALLKSTKLYHIKFFTNLMKLLQCVHLEDPIHQQTRADFGRRVIEKGNSRSVETEEIFTVYFKDMTLEEFEDASLLYPMPEPIRLLDTPLQTFASYVKTFRYTQDEGIFFSSEQKLVNQFNDLYLQKKMVFRPDEDGE